MNHFPISAVLVSMIAITNYQKLGNLKQQEFIFWLF